MSPEGFDKLNESCKRNYMVQAHSTNVPQEIDCILPAPLTVEELRHAYLTEERIEYLFSFLRRANNGRLHTEARQKKKDRKALRTAKLSAPKISDTVPQTNEEDPLEIESLVYNGEKLEFVNSVYKESLKSSDVCQNIEEHKKLQQSMRETDFFFDYYEEPVVSDGVSKGTMLEGTLRINQKQYREAYVRIEKETDIFIKSVRNRNRALEGDKVVVELEDESKWKKFPTGEVQKVGKVVYIKEKKHSRLTVGILEKRQAYQLSGGVLVPRDARFPRVKIPKEQWPEDYDEDPDKYKNILFLGRVTEWDNTHFAKGEIVKEIGNALSIESETEAILIENELDVSPFVDYEKYLPKLPFAITEDERRRRLDLRNWCVFSIDPMGARDLDDALSCSILKNGNYEVGVHISDVSFFIEHGTEFDTAIQNKATTIYFNHVAYHMLPPELCDICSLTPGQDKLAFSLIIELTPDARLVSHTFSRSVIRSCGQFTYHHAQEAIEKGDKVLENAENYPPVSNGYSLSDFVKSVSMLFKLSRIMRARRYANGALSLDQPKLRFRINNEMIPVGYSLDFSRESNRLVEEFMLLANSITAEHINTHYPNIALLRSHPPPLKRQLSETVKMLEKSGVVIQTETAGEMQKSLNQYYRSTEDHMRMRYIVLVNLLSKPMLKANYYCTAYTDNDAMWHYALNVQCYTHFTSPIRRYADIVVHRLVAASLGYTDPPDWSPVYVQMVADTCNKRKNDSEKASEASALLFLKSYIIHNGPVETDCVVAEVKDHSFDVITLEFSTVHKIYLTSFRKDNISFKTEKKQDDVYTFEIMWPAKQGKPKLVQVIELFAVIRVSLSYNEEENKIRTRVIRP